MRWKFLLAIFLMNVVTLTISYSLTPATKLNSLSSSQNNNLLTIYQLALQFDPTYRKAYATYQATLENFPIARAKLLPNVSVQASTTRNLNPLPLISNTFSGYSIGLSQPVIAVADLLNTLAANYQVKAASATYNAALQDLMQRVVTKYFAVLQAQDNLQIAQQQLLMNQENLRQTQLFFKAGIKQTADVDAAQAALDSSHNAVLTAQQAVTKSENELQAITTVTVMPLVALRKTINFMRPQPAYLTAWVDYIAAHNLTILSDHYTMLAQQKNIQVQAAGNLPTVNANVGVGHQQQDVFQNANFSNTNSSASLTLNFPIFSGGEVVAETRQAIFNYHAAQAQLQIDYQTAVAQAKTSFAGLLTDLQKINFDRRAVTSNTVSWQHTKTAYEAGTVNYFDVLQAEESLFSAKRDLVADEYQYFTDYVNLKQAAGLLTVSDLEVINNFLI